MKIGIIADLHEDIIRTKEAIDLLKSKECDKIVCLGDMLGIAIPYYGYLKSRNGSEVLRIIKENCDIVLLGNHDLYSVKKLPSSGEFNYPENWYSLDYPTRKNIGEGKVELHEYNELSPLISEEEKSYVEKLPDYCIREYDGVNILFSHWIYPDFAGTTKFRASEIEDYDKLFTFMEKNNCKINIAGHCHRKRYFFSKSGLLDIDFDSKFKVEESIGGFVIPCVANGTEPNGVAIFDTKSLEMEFLPLNTKPHVVPERAKL